MMISEVSIQPKDAHLTVFFVYPGVEGILQKIKVNPETGLTSADFPQRTIHFGSNYREPLKAKSFGKLFCETLDDFMLKVLIVCAVFSIVFEMLVNPTHLETAWIEGAAILVAVLVVTIVGSSVDFRKEQEFVKQRAKSDEMKMCNVLRNSAVLTIHHQHLHVGDIIIIKEGMYIPVDGLVLAASQLTVNEAAMTGESDELRKDTVNNCNMRLEDKNLERKQELKSGTNAKELDKHEIPSPLLLSGTNVQGGEGKFVAVMVGDMSAIGQIIKQLVTRPETTPLQNKLEEIATDIGKLGTYVALLSVHVLLFRYFLEGLIYRNVDLFGGSENIQCRGVETDSITDAECEKMMDNAPKGIAVLLAALSQWLEYLIIGVAIIVVAVPEGLPLAVMISLAYSIKRMLEDNNDVKRLASCEIMGGADNICSDKTGTLTRNEMKVTNIWAGKDVTIPQGIDHDTNKMLPFDWKMYFSENHAQQFQQGIACNTPESVNATDRATIEFLERMGCDIVATRMKHLPKTDMIRFPFSSKRKRMSTVLENLGNGGYDKRLHIKGASEIVKNSCSHYLTESGERVEMTDTMKGNLDNVINQYAKQALRTIALGYKDIQPGEFGPRHDEHDDQPVKEIELTGFTLTAIVGIMDIVRAEVPNSVLKVQKAGVTVRMITGDNLVTAMAIAEKCNIITSEEIGDEHICVEGPIFYETVGGLTCKTCG